MQRPLSGSVLVIVAEERQAQWTPRWPLEPLQGDDTCHFCPPVTDENKSHGRAGEWMSVISTLVYTTPKEGAFFLHFLTTFDT